MVTEKVELKIVTPLFMSGADSDNAELRVPSIKGVMRYFYRAAMAEDNLEKLRKKETDLFGGASDKDSFRAKVGMFIKNTDRLPKQNDFKGYYNFRWYFNSSERTLTGNDRGIGYMMYSVISPKQEFIENDTKFSLVFAGEERYIKKYLAALWISVYFGGFGKRSRRGAGDVVFVKEPNIGMDGFEFVLNESSVDGIANWLRKNFSIAVRILGASNNDFAYSYTNFSMSRVIISKNSFGKWSDALNDIGIKYMDFRINHRGDVLESAAFGLPIIHSDGSKVVPFDNNDRKNRSNRRSSPLIFKVLESNGKYYWMITRLSGEFLPKGTVVSVNGNSGRTKKVNYSLIDEFWFGLKKNNLEFILNKPKRLDEIVEQIDKKMNPEKISLFGSRARGDFEKNSDIDIYVKNPKQSGIDINGPIDIVTNLDKAILEKEEVVLKDDGQN